MWFGNSLVSRTIGWVASGVFLAASSVPAAAQTSVSARPFHGALFGANRADASAQRLDLSIVFLESYDDNVFATTGGSVNPGAAQSSGYYSMLQPSLDYRWGGRRTQLAVSEASALGYYPQLGRVRSISHSAGAGFSVQVGRRGTFLLNQTAAYSPSYLYGLFPGRSAVAPGDVIPGAPNYAVRDIESYAYGSNARATYGVSTRTSVALGADFRYTNFIHETALQRDMDSKGVDAQILNQRTRNVSLRTRYHYLTGDLGYVAGAITDEHGLEAGVSYSRRLSPTRRAVFTADLGSSAIKNNGGARISVPRRLYRASGDASLSYQFAGSWQLSSTYRRGLEFVPSLTQPVFTNGVTADLSGLLSRRLDVALSGGYSQGASALTRSALHFDTYQGSLRFQFALTKTSAIHVEYLYYLYDFLGITQLAPGVSPRLERNGVRVGLRLFVPALRG
jgi:hypothetical protein